MVYKIVYTLWSHILLHTMVYVFIVTRHFILWHHALETKIWPRNNIIFWTFLENHKKNSNIFYYHLWDIFQITLFFVKINFRHILGNILWSIKRILFFFPCHVIMTSSTYSILLPILFYDTMPHKRNEDLVIVIIVWNNEKLIYVITISDID